MLCYAFNLLMAFDRLLLKGLLTYLIVLVNVYKCAKFQLSNSINDGDMQGVPK